MNSEQISSREKKLREFQENLGYTFHDRGLLETALCHSSYSNEHGERTCNERLEFLGDAVLELTVSDMLFNFYTNFDEGELTKKRASLVCHDSLFNVARSLKLDSLVLCGNSMRHARPASVSSDAFEAVLGAVYLDGGFDEAFRVVERHVVFLAPESNQNPDPKSRLQMIAQEKKLKMPAYTTLSVEGPDHAPTFTVKLVFCGREWTGEGSSKKAAEFAAAEKALKE